MSRIIEINKVYRLSFADHDFRGRETYFELRLDGKSAGDFCTSEECLRAVGGIKPKDAESHGTLYLKFSNGHRSVIDRAQYEKHCRSLGLAY